MLILKVMHQGPYPGDETGPHSLYGDLSSVHFEQREDGYRFARVWQRDPVKTIGVPGFVEHEKLITVEHDAYVLNENGRTISVSRVRQDRS